MTKFLTYLLVPVVFILGMWLSSGTLTPYAYTLNAPKVLEECQYLANLDHSYFEANFSFLAGAEITHLQTSDMLRRILFPLLAYPFVKYLGMQQGGFLAAVLISLICFYIFTFHISRKLGAGSALVCSSLLATYPGTMYWIGLPYCYVTIVPISLLCYLALEKLSASHSVRERGLVFLGMGFLFLGYELIPFFGLPALWLIRKKQNKWILICLGSLLILPTVLMLAYLHYKGIPSLNPNTATYFNILQAYLHPSNFRRWAGLVVRFPIYLVEAYFFSNFFFLPFFFLSSWLVMKQQSLIKLSEVDWAILISGFLLYAFNNLAPPYSGWQMRGGWILRLYQPLFVVYVVFLSRIWQVIHGRFILRRIYAVVICLIVFGNGIVVFGPYLGSKWNLKFYEKFYGHGTPGMSAVNLEKYGRRPLGICH